MYIDVTNVYTFLNGSGSYCKSVLFHVVFVIDNYYGVVRILTGFLKETLHQLGKIVYVSKWTTKTIQL